MVLGLATVGYSQVDVVSVASESGLDILFGGEVEMEFVDVEGPGGFTNQDLTYQKVKTRSPHMRIDKAILSARANYSENLFYKIEFRFGDNKAFVDKHYAQLKLPSINTEVEIGKNKPFMRTKRRTEGYPLIGTAFWKGREYHIASKTELTLSDQIEIEGGLSFNMKRPLGSDDAAEDKSFKMIVYDDYDNKDGQTFEYGSTLTLKAFGLSAQGWYYTGELIDDFDWKTQLSQTLAGYDDMGDRSDRTHWWYGGRGGFDRFGIHIRGEYISAQDGLLPRDGYYVEGSYSLETENFLPVQAVEPLFRYGTLNLRRHPPLLGETESWDRTMTTVALLTRVNDYLTVKLEYYLLDEATGGDPPEDDHVKDNQLLLQVKYEF
jgi:hypothetical protein|tara:strand:+ start:3411 stop:4544 length:1134 start_codon:yes stop_codon:yes gene_type:complete